VEKVELDENEFGTMESFSNKREAYNNSNQGAHFKFSNNQNEIYDRKEN
jgi:hypothetical protein